MGNARRYIRLAGPFEAYRLGPFASHITVCDLSEGGCFVSSVNAPPAPGRNLLLKIKLPHEGSICLKAESLYAKPGFGFAVTFVDVPNDASDRLRRGLLRLQGTFSTLILDRDPVYTAAFRRLLRDGGVKPLVLSAWSPNLNAFAARFVGSAKSECLERIVPLGEGHLRAAGRAFVQHYHEERPHQREAA